MPSYRYKTPYCRKVSCRGRGACRGRGWGRCSAPLSAAYSQAQVKGVEGGHGSDGATRAAAPRSTLQFHHPLSPYAHMSPYAHHTPYDTHTHTLFSLPPPSLSPISLFPALPLSPAVLSPSLPLFLPSSLDLPTCMNVCLLGIYVRVCVCRRVCMYAHAIYARKK